MKKKELLERIERAGGEKKTFLDLCGQRLTSLPPEIGRLTNLTGLHLDRKSLRSVPAELGQLTNVTQLDLRNNQLTWVPAELGRLTKLETLGLGGNKDLTSPPPEVVEQGTKAMLACLRELDKGAKQGRGGRMTAPKRQAVKGCGGKEIVKKPSGRSKHHGDSANK